MYWLNEPAKWSQEQSELLVRTSPSTDFWQRTHYDFRRDNGHFYYQRVVGDFTAAVTVRGEYKDQYDQGGLMARLSETTWLKTGIEYVDGVQQASVVVTRDFSDWSVTPLHAPPREFRVRLSRVGDAFTVEGSTDAGSSWQLMRIAHLTDSEFVEVGPMCASPDGQGFDVVLADFEIDSPP